MKHVTLSALFSSILLLAAGPALAGPDESPPIPVHDVTVRIVPSTHRLVGADHITFPRGEVRSCTFHLSPTLDVLSVSAGGLDMNVPARRPNGSFRIDVAASEVTIRYAGTIHEGVTKEEDLSWVRGDGTSGFIGEEGVYLSTAAAWYPLTEEHRLARVNVTTYIPAPWLTVTQGSVPERSTIQGRATSDTSRLVSPLMTDDGEGPQDWNVAVSKAGIPTDGVALVAGQYVTKSAEVDGVTVSTYFAEQDARLQDLWLREAVATVKRYTPILGKYPHAKFDVVSNFFQTGYGMPGWTLLGDRVIRYVSAKAARSGGIPPGYLDHEYVHGWFGNGLFVDYATGNWCEAITSYYSNYLARELESKEAAVEYRRGVLEKFAIRVHGAADYPLREFRVKVEDADNDVGYGKGSLLFHMIRRQVGDAVFFDTVKRFTQARLGTVVSWDDWFDILAKNAGQDVRAHVGPWLERKGVPEVRMEEVTASTGALEVTLAQGSDGAPWPLYVPLEVEHQDGTRSQHEVELTSHRATFRTAITSPAVTVRVDPGFDVLRRIPAGELPLCLNRTLQATNGVVRVDDREVFGALADRIAKSTGWRQEHGPVSGPAVILEVAANLESIEVGGTSWSGDDIAVMQTTLVDGEPQTRYTALSNAAAARAGYATYYGWDSWVVFKGGRPVARSVERPESGATTRLLAVVEDGAARVRRIRDTVDALCSDGRAGRAPGTPEHASTRAYLKQAMRERGVDWVGPIDLSFDIWVTDAKDRGNAITWRQTDGGQRGFTGGHGPDSGVRAFSFSGNLDAPDWHALDALEIVDWSGGSIEALHAVAIEAEARGQKGVIVRLDPSGWKKHAAWLDLPADLSKVSEDDLARPGRDGRPRPRPVIAPWIHGRRARGGNVHLQALPIPVVAVPANWPAQQPTDPQPPLASVRDVNLVVNVKRQKIECQNLVFHAKAANAPKHADRPPVVLLMAHYDALGTHGERRFLGADDNGSGVACLLEVCRDLGTLDGRVGVLVAFPDAEEWGLLGSRELVKQLAPHFDVRAVVNVDSVGRGASQPTFVLGVTKHPKLAAAMTGRLVDAGLEIGRDIDKYAYAYGSDHWPFHLAGIPSISIWASDYTVMNTVDDTPENVEPHGIADIAAAIRALIDEDLDDL